MVRQAQILEVLMDTRFLVIGMEQLLTQGIILFLMLLVVMFINLQFIQ